MAHIKINEHTTLTKNKKGWYLYDELRGMNLAMCAETSELAMVEALEYYQRRLPEVEQNLCAINKQVENFLLNLGVDENELPIGY